MSIWRERAKKRLFLALGNVCHYCGKTAAEVVLVVCHKTPLTAAEDDRRRRIGSTHRLVQYRKDHAAGLIVLGCQSCNVRESYRQTVRAEPDPF